MIRFTIITCTYNASSVLQRTLSSVMMQKYEYVEHRILDGKSKDTTLGIAEKYKKENDATGCKHEIIIRSEPDKGLYDAMNKGIRQANGDYIIFLNAGDVFPNSDTLSTIASSVKDRKTLPGIIYGDTDIVDMDGKFIRHRRLSPGDKITWRSFKYGMLICHQAFYARTDIAKTTPYNDKDFRLSADVDWCIRIMKKSENKHLPLLHVNAVVVNYLEGGMSIQNHKASLKERFCIMKKHYGLTTTVLMHLYFVFRSISKK